MLYFASYIVTHVDRARINNEMADLRSNLEAAIVEIDKQTTDLIEDADVRYGRDLEEHREEHTIEMEVDRGA